MTIVVKRAIGVDLHTNKFTVYYLEEEKGRIVSYHISEMNEFMNELRRDDIIAVEASTNTFAFVRKISSKVKDVYVVNPIQYGIIHNTQKKTDKIDAKKLAYGAKYHAETGGHHLPLVYVPEEKVSELRSLFTTYEQIKMKVNMTRNRIHSILKANLMPYNKKDIYSEENREEILKLKLASGEKLQIQLMYDELFVFYGQKDILEKEICKYVVYYEKEVKTMVSASGVSIMGAMALKADYAEVDRFGNSKRFTSYLGSAPGVDSSNTKTYIGSVNKHSRKLALSMLIQGLPHYWKSDEYLTNFREKKLAGKSAGKVRIAIARKLLVSLYFMLKRNELHKNTNKVLYNCKIREIDKIIQEVRLNS